MTASSLPPLLLPLAYTPDALHYAKQLAELTGFVWLDSGTHRAYGGRYEFLTALPLSVYEQAAAGAAQLNGVPTALTAEQWQQQEIDLFAPAAEPELAFCGGILGYIHYEYGCAAQGLAAPPSPEPLLHLGVYTWVLLQDHIACRSQLYFSNRCPADTRQAVLAQLAQAAPPLPPFVCSAFAPATSKADYLSKIEKILAYIQAGDAYQVNLSQRFSAECSGPPLAAYAHLRAASPSPYGAFFSTPKGAILSLSPEQFIGITQGEAVTHPIKGTAKRGATEAQDAELAQALSQSIKNRAENLMIVDLLRNDFSKNCAPFSVATPELFQLKTYANVHHLVSCVRGQLKPGISPWQFFYACFPGGSITGAPKKRAMEIIAELEDQPRRIYCGCIYYWSANGRLDSSITIRTLRIDGHEIHVWGGGGIVADSLAEDEYAESLQKIALLQNTLTSI